MFAYLLCFLGAGISFYLTYVKLTSSPLICNFGDCHAVQNSQYSVLFGIPVAAFGALYYIALFTLIFYKTKKLWYAWTAWGFIFSTYLTYLELYVIKAICMYCVASYVIVIIMCVLCVYDYLKLKKGLPNENNLSV